MKLLGVILVVLCASFIAQAQVGEPDNDSGISVLKFSWNKERIGWERDPFGGPIENFDEMRVRARNEKRIMDAKKGGNGSEIARAEKDARTDDALISTIHQNTPARYAFVYQVVLQNNSTKAITSIDWDYVFFDMATEEELGRRQFTSEGRFSPGKTRQFKFFIPNAPTKTISVDALNKHERDGLGEAIKIVRVEYADGTVWQLQ